MYSIDSEIKAKLLEINSTFLNIYDSNLFDKLNLRNFINENIAKINQAQKLDNIELKNLGNIAAVDGSFNRFGGNYPHYIDFYKALAKDSKNGDIIETYVDMPSFNLLNNQSEDESNTNDSEILSRLEIKMAIKAIEKYKPLVLFMDGGLIRYKITASDSFERLRQISKENNTLVLGIIKDIKTDMISRKFEEMGICEYKLYDREILYGILNSGEYFITPDSLNLKFSEGLRTAFANLSSNPDVIGVEIFDFELHNIELGINLAYSLTPKHSRGIPLLIDIVDKEARITDEMIKTSVKSFLDPRIYELFLNAERNKRTL